MTSRTRRRKWNRRILIAETLLSLHLTHVKDKGSDVWFCMDDIRDLWESEIIPSGLKKSANMTDQELSNRLKSIWALDCVDNEYRDYSWREINTGVGRRRRQVYFKLTDEEKLRAYIAQWKERRNSL